MPDFLDRDLTKKVLDSNPVLYQKIQSALECPSDFVAVALIEVIRFIKLVAESDTVLTPSHKVDLVWHEFILCTRAYQAFCTMHFGKMIHHTPGGTTEDNRRQFKETLIAYRRSFGEPNPELWGVGVPQSECGPCQST